MQTSGPAASSSPAAARTELWIKRHPARDPFVALAGNEPGRSPTTPLCTRPTDPGWRLPAPAETPVAQPAAPTAPETQAPAAGATETPVAVPVKVKPSIVVLYANGKKQAVAVGEYFKARDLWFRLDAVKPKTIELSLADGGSAATGTRSRSAATTRSRWRTTRPESSTPCASRRRPPGSPRPRRPSRPRLRRRRRPRRRPPCPPRRRRTKAEVNEMTFHMPRPRLLIHAALVVVCAAVLRDRIGRREVPRAADADQPADLPARRGHSRTPTSSQRGAVPAYPRVRVEPRSGGDPLPVPALDTP